MQANIIRITQQLQYFQQYQLRVTRLIGSEQTKRLVNQALVLITLGGNDFVNNYFLVPYSARSRQYNLPDYVKYLISEYQKILKVYISILHFVFQICFSTCRNKNERMLNPFLILCTSGSLLFSRNFFFPLLNSILQSRWSGKLPVKFSDFKKWMGIYIKAVNHIVQK